MTGTPGRFNTYRQHRQTHFPTHSFTGMLTLSEHCQPCIKGVLRAAKSIEPMRGEHL